MMMPVFQCILQGFSIGEHVLILGGIKVYLDPAATPGDFKWKLVLPVPLFI